MSQTSVGPRWTMSSTQIRKCTRNAKCASRKIGQIYVFAFTLGPSWSSWNAWVEKCMQSTYPFFIALEAWQVKETEQTNRDAFTHKHLPTDLIWRTYWPNLRQKYWPNLWQKLRKLGPVTRHVNLCMKFFQKLRRASIRWKSRFSNDFVK